MDSIARDQVRDNVPALAGVRINISQELFGVPRTPSVGEKHNGFGDALTINQVRPHSAHHVWKTQPAAC
jgi:hypothetical protein